jgi:ubiquinone/menaquinone biosynthesis C-methylase UbiE
MTEDQFKEVAAQLRQPHGEAGVQTGIRMNEGNALINRFTFDALAPASGELILEIGMGNGYFIRELLQKTPGLRYIGCDFSETMITEATRLNRELVDGERVQFFLSAADHLPVRAQSVDKVFTVNTLYFWPDEKAVLNEIARVLKPGGKVVISIRPKWQMEQYPFTKFGFAMYDRSDLQRLLSENNFQIESVWEREEPRQEIAGDRYKVASLIVAAFKK